MKYQFLVLILALGLLLCACDSAGSTNVTTTPNNGTSPTSPLETDDKDDITLPEDLQENELPPDFFDAEDQVLNSKPVAAAPADPTEPPATQPAVTKPVIEEDDYETEPGELVPDFFN